MNSTMCKDAMLLFTSLNMVWKIKDGLRYLIYPIHMESFPL